MRSQIFLSTVLLVLLTFTGQAFAQNWKSQFTAELKNGGAIAVDASGKVLYEFRGNDSFIPASTIKVATAAAALKYLGRDYRFVTEVYTGGSDTLYMKGYGDPFLVSEEFKLIAKEISDKGIKSVHRIVVDNSYFDSHIAVDGASASTNPYDALNGALIANFNTINIIKTGNDIRSAESQTPLTPLVRDAAQKLGKGTQRVNLGRDPDIGARYAGELLREFLRQAGVQVDDGEVKIGTVLESAPLLLAHKSSKTLSEDIKDMLEFSTNFMSNQLFLVLGAKKFGAPATVNKSLSVVKDFLKNEIGWQNFELAEGAGLSRQNQVTPREMITLLKYFEPNRDLLPIKEDVLHAKTGTLTGVNTLIGYFQKKSGDWVTFAILVNSSVPFDYKFKLGKMLYDGLSGN